MHDSWIHVRDYAVFLEIALGWRVLKTVRADGLGRKVHKTTFVVSVVCKAKVYSFSWGCLSDFSDICAYSE